MYAKNPGNHGARHLSMLRRLAWENGRLLFSGETLGMIAFEFNRYNRQKLFVMDSDIAELRFGGVFATTDVQGFVAILTQHTEVRATFIGDKQFGVILLRARGSKAVRA